MGDEIYYQHAGRVPFIKRISARARQSVYRSFVRAMQPGPDTTVLDVGVSLDVESREANMLEQLHPWRNLVTCAGIGDGDAVVRAYPGVQYTRIVPHAALPFRDGAFAMAHCNAVLEHAGSRDQQRFLVAELCRVAERVFLVVPNRLFPVEQHTGLPLVHWLPLQAFRGLMRRTPLRFWAEEANLNPFFPWDLEGVLPTERGCRIQPCGLGIGWLSTNMAVIITKR